MQWHWDGGHIRPYPTRGHIRPYPTILAIDCVIQPLRVTWGHGTFRGDLGTSVRGALGALVRGGIGDIG
jgi:hypothetical protein